jgi:hypothetical protein
MIAKVLRSGSGFSGVIEYLYEGKLESRKAEDKRAEVILHSDNLRVPRDWQDVAGRQRMKADFIEQARSHRLHKSGGKDLIGEHVLSFTQDDIRKLRTTEGVRQVTAEYVKLLGMEQTQHVAIMHRDTDNPHLHILFNRVTNERKKFNDSWEKKRAVGAGVSLAQKYDLHLVGGLSREAKEPRAKTMRAGMEDLKKLQAQHPLFSQARNLHHLEKLADKTGLEIEQTGDRIMVGGTDYKLSDLDAMFQANRNAAAKKKKAATSGKTGNVTQTEGPEQEALRAQERQELFNSLGMGQFEAKARRMGIEIHREPEHLTFNGERYETRQVEAHLAENFEQARQARQQHARQLAEKKANKEEKTQQEPTLEPQLLMRDATSMKGPEKTAPHRGIEFDQNGQSVRLGGGQYPLQEVEAMRAEKKHKVDSYRVANGLSESPDVGQAPEKESVERVSLNNAPQQTTMPRDPETAAYLEKYAVKSVALETATSMDDLKRLCQQEGAFFAVGEHFTKVGDQSLRNEWMEGIMAENVKRQQNRPLHAEIPEASIQNQADETLRPEESPEQVVAQITALETRLNTTVAGLTSARNQLADLEAQAPQAEFASMEPGKEIAPSAEQQPPTHAGDAELGNQIPDDMRDTKVEDRSRSLEIQDKEYRKADLQHIFPLNARNPNNQRDRGFDHRQKGEQKLDGAFQSQKHGGRLLGLGKIGHGAEQAGNADPIRPTPQPKQRPRRRRPGKKKIPDYLQKLARQQKQSRSQSHNL